MNASSCRVECPMVRMIGAGDKEAAGRSARCGFSFLVFSSVFAAVVPALGFFLVSLSSGTRCLRRIEAFSVIVPIPAASGAFGPEGPSSFAQRRRLTLLHR